MKIDRKELRNAMRNVAAYALHFNKKKDSKDLEKLIELEIKKLDILSNYQSNECFKTPVIASEQRTVCAKCARELKTYKDMCAPCRIADALLD